MRRYWIGIRASAVISIAGSLLALAFAGLMLVSLVLKPPPAGPTAPPFPMAVIGIAMSVVFSGFTGWGIWTAIAIFMRRGWARISIIVFATLLTLIGGCAALGMLFVPLPAQGAASQRMMDIARWGIGGFYALLAAIGVWWLILFNLKSTHAYFTEAAPGEPGARPLSISMIAWLLLAGSLMCALPALLPLPAFAFGVILTGWGARGVYIAFAIAQFLLGVGLLRLKEQARVAAIGYFCLTVLNGALAVAPPGLAAKMQILQREMPRWYPSATSIQMFQSGWVFVLPGIVLAAIPIWFLVRRHDAFVKPASVL